MIDYGTGTPLWETTREAEARQEREQETQARLVGQMQKLAETKDGAFFLRWLLDISGYFRSVPVMPHESMSYVEGQRSVGAQIFDICRQAKVAVSVCADTTEERG